MIVSEEIKFLAIRVVILPFRLFLCVLVPFIAISQKLDYPELSYWDHCKEVFEVFVGL